jgi:RHS Repeat
MKLSFRAIRESLLNTITAVGSVIFTGDRNLYILRGDGTPMKITDLIFVDTDAEIEAMSSPIRDKVYVSRESYMMYTWSGSEMIPVSGGGGGAPGRIKTVSGTTGSLTVTAPFTFQGTGMKVYKNGVLMEKGVEYTEASDGRSISVKRTVEEGDKFTFEISGGGPTAIEGIKYSMQREFNSLGLVVKETYTGDEEKTIEYFYDENDRIAEKRTTRDGVVASALYTYDDSGNLTEVKDNGTEIMAFGGGGSLSADEPIPAEMVTSSIEGSSNLKTDMESLVETIGDLIDNQEELERQHSLDIINTQMKYDIALNMVGNQCGDYYIDSLQGEENLTRFINCKYNETDESVR